MDQSETHLTWAGRLQILIPFAAGYFLSYLFRAINAVLAPNLVHDIGVDPAQLGLLTGTYFITFAAFQIPLGVLLDRFGPRRIETVLLVVAALGAWLFARADSLTGLVVGRGLIGVGVSACLMASFKAFVVWFPRSELPRINGFQMAAGGLGALTATAPVEAALAVTDWRGLFMLLAVLSMLAAVLIFTMVPERQTVGDRISLGAQVRGIGHILGSLTFWRIAPWATFSQAGFMSVQGLWAGPWLRDVAGMERQAAAGVLLALSAAMVAGFILLGVIAERLSRRGIAPIRLAVAGMVSFMLVLSAMILEVKAPLMLWSLFGFFGTSGVLMYAVLSQSFSATLAGRVNTTLNLLVFVAAFAFQWGIGVVVKLWPATAAGAYAPQGYRAALGVLLATQVMALGWFALAGCFTRGAADRTTAKEQ